MKAEKKFFVPTLYPIPGHRNNPKIRWYVWYIAPTENGQKQVNIYGKFSHLTTRADKERHATQLFKQVEELAEQYKRHKAFLEKSALIEYIKTNRKRWEPRTYTTYLSKATNWCKWLADNNITTITQKTGDDFIKHLIDANKTNTTINGYRRCLKIMYEKLIKLNKAKVNPFADCEYLKESKQTRMYFTIEQKKALKRVMIEKDQQLWLACCFLYYCFIRPKELRHLKIGDIVFSEKKIIIPGEIAKNDKTQPVRIPDAFYDIVKVLENYPLDYYVFGKDGEPGLRQLSENNLYNRHEKIMQLAGIRGKRNSLYSWKNTGIYFYLKNNGNIKQLQLQLRHHSLDQVNQYAQDFGLLDCDDIEKRFPEI